MLIVMMLNLVTDSYASCFKDEFMTYEEILRQDNDSTFINASASDIIQFRHRNELYMYTYSIVENKYFQTARCNYRKVGNGFMVINSIESPSSVVSTDVAINKTTDEDNIGKTLLTISFPNYWEFKPLGSPIIVYVTYKSTDRRYEVPAEGETKNGVCQMSLDGTLEYFKISFRPNEYLSSTSDMRYFGILSYKVSEIIQMEGNNKVEVTLPAVNQNLFSSYYIVNDYIHVDSGELEWRGGSFFRIELVSNLIKPVDVSCPEIIQVKTKR